MRALARLRWGAFGLRGRLVGAVLATTAITLLVASAVLLPRLQHSLQNAALNTLKNDVRAVKHGPALSALKQVPYTQIALLNARDYRDSSDPQHPLSDQYGRQAASLLDTYQQSISQRLGTSDVHLIGYIDQQGYGKLVTPPVGPGDASDGSTDVSIPTWQIRQSYLQQRTIYSFGTLPDGSPVISTVIYLNNSSVLLVHKSIDEISGAVQAVRRAFEIAALVAILLTLVLAIPLAGTLVRRLQRLREAALQIAIGGSGAAAEFPTDRARDEVGDLARSFSIMQRRLRQQEQARRRFVATASHELRTPLASLDGMLELLAEDLADENLDLNDAAVLLDRARAQSRRLGRLAADLLDLSRIDADITLRSEPLELGEMVRAVLAEFEIASSERGVAAVLRDGGQQAWALGDPGSIARILRILLDNALRVAPRGSNVTVTVTAGPRPSVKVSDRGPGVSPEERGLIFERFKRGRETGGEAGFGLGLAIGRELAERMGGSLALSDDDAPGATFVLTLPAASAPAQDPIPAGAGV